MCRVNNNINKIQNTRTMEKATITYLDDETGCERKLKAIKGYFITVSPETGTKILVSATNDDIHIGVVDVARYINPQEIGAALELLRIENTTMVTSFLERLICRLGELDQPLLTWMYEHKELVLPELKTAWEAVKANYQLRHVNENFSIKRAERAVQRIMEA